MLTKMSRLPVWVGLIALAFSFPASAGTVSLDFELISNNTSSGGGTAPTLFSVDVFWDEDQVEFQFFNSDTDGIITDIYWESLLPGDAEPLDYNTAVLPPDWSSLANPGELPGAPTDFASAFSSDSDPPPVGNGIHPGGNAIFGFDLIGGDSSAFANAILSGALRLGIRVQDINGGIGGEDNPFSESYITTTVVPVPPALSLVIIGMGSLMLRRRRMRA